MGKLSKEHFEERLEKLKARFLGKTFGHFEVIDHDGYRPPQGQVYERHYWKVKCCFCNEISIKRQGTLVKWENQNKGHSCMSCHGAVNYNTNEKCCSQCKTWLPATTRYFPRSKNRKFGLHYYCKKCQNARIQRRREDPAVRQAEYDQKKRREEYDPLFKLSKRIRVLIKNSIVFHAKAKWTKAGRFKKTSKTCKILGCSFEDMKLHIEKQFEPHMSWDNYGSVWSYEHIVSMGLAETEEEANRLNNYINFKPIDEKLNGSISDRVIEEWLTPEIIDMYSDILERNKHMMSSIDEFNHIISETSVNT